MLVRFFAILVLFLGCSYKPVSKLPNDIFGQKVYVETTISLSDPRNSVLISDALKEAMISRFHRILVPKDEATTSIKANIQSVSFNPLVYDDFGYVISYEAIVKIKFVTYFNNQEIDNAIMQGDYSFNIESNSVISDTKRYEAIKFASIEAINEYVSSMALKGMIWQAP